MIAFDFIQQHQSIRSALEDVFGKQFNQGPKFIMNKISQWFKQGRISEGEPVQFLLNIISLSLFPFIAKPIIEVILNIKTNDADFIQKRTNSVVNLLKRGMLK